MLASKKALKMAQLRHPDLPPKKAPLIKIVKKDEMLGSSDILILPHHSNLISENNKSTTKKVDILFKIVNSLNLVI